MKKEEYIYIHSCKRKVELANISLPSVLRTQTVWKRSHLAPGKSVWIIIQSVIHLGLRGYKTAFHQNWDISVFVSIYLYRLIGAMCLYKYIFAKLHKLTCKKINKSLPFSAEMTSNCSKTPTFSPFTQIVNPWHIINELTYFHNTQYYAITFRF